MDAADTSAAAARDAALAAWADMTGPTPDRTETQEFRNSGGEVIGYFAVGYLIGIPVYVANVVVDAEGVCADDADYADAKAEADHRFTVGCDCDACFARMPFAT